MDLNFIGQGLNPESDRTTGHFIIESLSCNDYNSLYAFVAFVSLSGLNNIIEPLIDFKENGGTIRLYFGVDLNATSKEALEKLIEHEIESYVVYSPNNIIYHPKIYAFEGELLTRAIIGSSNLTVSGLFQNIEASVCVDFNNEDENGNDFLSEIYEHFNSIINLEHESSQKLTPEILDLLVQNKVVLSESQNRNKNNIINKYFKQKNYDNNLKLLNVFGKIKSKRPPIGFNKSITKEELVVEPGEMINVVYETEQLATGSMWIETRKMTGGSRNILDLSKTGSLDGVRKFGSVSFFGVDPEDTTITKIINIHLGRKIYNENPIFFADKNQNWRIQLKGVTEMEEKLTTISKPNLGQNGGFVNKILLFTKIDDVNFKLEILDSDEMEKLIENSSDWAKGGRGGTGRSYGII